MSTENQNGLRYATLRTIHSLHGHDGSLIDAAAINDEVKEWRANSQSQRARSASFQHSGVSQ